jgi:hypothetical protein
MSRRDIVEQLRTWVHAVDAVPASDMMDEAAAEIERLRAIADRRGDLAVERRREIARLRLTAAEREAVEFAYSRLTADAHYASVAATLRGLLERTK